MIDKLKHMGADIEDAMRRFQGNEGLYKRLLVKVPEQTVNLNAAEYFEKNPECAACEYAKECVGGCRAAALETTPDDILGKDTFACELFKGGWKPKIQAAAQAGMEIYRQKYDKK